VPFEHCDFNNMKENAMKIKTKVRAGGCRGGGGAGGKLPVSTD
jgi:hypothetical protein